MHSSSKILYVVYTAAHQYMSFKRSANLHALLLLVRSLGALTPQLTARVGGVVTAPARAIAEIVATSAQAPLAFGDGRGIASALLALALPRYLEKCKLEQRNQNVFRQVERYLCDENIQTRVQKSMGSMWHS